MHDEEEKVILPNEVGLGSGVQFAWAIPTSEFAACGAYKSEDVEGSDKGLLSSFFNSIAAFLVKA